VTPSVRLAPTRRLTVTIDHAWFWRYSVHDGLYGIGVNVVRPGSESRARSVGRQFTAQADLRNGDHLTLSMTFTAFAAGRFLRETPPGADVAYVAVNSTYRF
jgi:Alginate export